MASVLAEAQSHIMVHHGDDEFLIVSREVHFAAAVFTFENMGATLV